MNRWAIFNRPLTRTAPSLTVGLLPCSRCALNADEGVRAHSINHRYRKWLTIHKTASQIFGWRCLPHGAFTKFREIAKRRTRKRRNRLFRGACEGSVRKSVSLVTTCDSNEALD